MENPLRVAQVMGKWVGGGVESVIMNYYQNINKEKIQFDFLFDRDSSNIPKKEIESLGGRVFLISPYQNFLKYQKDLTKLLRENQYKIVHSNINALSVFSLRAAKKANIPIRIAHSHSTTNKKEWKKNLLKQVLRPFSKVYANQYFACSELAGRWLFGNKFFEKGKVTIINNAIDTRKFQYNEETRKKKRKELNINQDTLVIGHIGRFVEQKNQLFLLEVFNELHKANTNSILILIGQGPMVSEVKNKIKELKLEDTVLLLGQRDDVADLYQALDVFVLPSLYEGLGMVLIEAQCSGLPCIASTEVPNIAKINSNFKYIDLKKPATIWSNEILILAADNKRNTDTKRIRDAKFDIKEEAFNLEKAYEDMVMNMNT